MNFNFFGSLYIPSDPPISNPHRGGGERDGGGGGEIGVAWWEKEDSNGQGQEGD